jgi:hypothetical protein
MLEKFIFKKIRDVFVISLFEVTRERDVEWEQPKEKQIL